MEHGIPPSKTAAGACERPGACLAYPFARYEADRRMTAPVIITVAITGAVPRKKDNPAIPVTPEEQIESTHEAFEAGARTADRERSDQKPRRSN